MGNMAKLPSEEIIQRLEIPVRFNSKKTDDQEVASWNNDVCLFLNNLKNALNPSLPPEVVVPVIASVAALCGHQNWLESKTSSLSNDILSAIHPTVATLREVLEKHVKPAFLASPHPQLNLSSGRVLPQNAGGNVAAQDLYDEQTWKDRLGLSNLLSWCIRHISAGDYEKIWHLIIPPIMTFLDDFKASFKLQGIILASELLNTVPDPLLLRTGVGKLLLASLTRHLTFLHDELTPELIRHAVPTTLTLLDKITVPDSGERFDNLCQIMGDQIVGGVWLYASHEHETIEASFDVLPSLIERLKIGTARYLKALIPQCVHCITPRELAPISASLQISALRTLAEVLSQCGPRMQRWKGTIIDGVGRCWVAWSQNTDSDKNKYIVTLIVKHIFTLLSSSCPSVLEEEYPRLLQIDSETFSSVIPLSLS